VRPTDAVRAPEDVRKYLDEISSNCINSSGSALLLRRCFQRFSIQTPSTFPPATTLSGTGSVQKFDGYLRVYQMPASIADREDDEKDDEGEGRSLPQVVEGQTLRLDKIRPDQPLHRAAAAVQRCDAGEGARRRRHRAALDLCFDQFKPSVEREYVTKDRGDSRTMPWVSVLSVLLIKSFEDFSTSRLPRGSKRTRRNRGRQAALARSRPKKFWKNSSLTSTRPATRCFSQADPHGEKVRKCGQGRIARAHQPARFLPGLFRATPMRFPFKTLAELPEETSGEPTIEYCENCGKEMAIKRGRLDLPRLHRYPDCRPRAACPGHAYCAPT